MTKKFDPLAETVKAPPLKNKQSVELAPDPEPVQKFDTETPAVVFRAPRRFTLADLPRYADSLYPHLKDIFPHVNDRMYGGWIRGCINDNSCLFVCIDAPEGMGGAAGMAFIRHDALDPVPYVDVLFVIGAEPVRIAIYEKVMQWAQEVGAQNVRVRARVADDTLKKIPGVKLREEKMSILTPA